MANVTAAEMEICSSSTLSEQTTPNVTKTEPSSNVNTKKCCTNCGRIVHKSGMARHRKSKRCIESSPSFPAVVHQLPAEVLTGDDVSESKGQTVYVREDAVPDITAQIAHVSEEVVPDVAVEVESDAVSDITAQVAHVSEDAVPDVSVEIESQPDYEAISSDSDFDVNELIYGKEYSSKNRDFCYRVLDDDSSIDSEELGLRVADDVESSDSDSDSSDEAYVVLSSNVVPSILKRLKDEKFKYVLLFSDDP